jgi:hypothetical protein
LVVPVLAAIVLETVRPALAVVAPLREMAPVPVPKVPAPEIEKLPEP